MVNRFLMTQFVIVVSLAIAHATPNRVRAAEPAQAPAPVGLKLADFSLVDAVKNQPWSLADSTRDAKATVIVFLATGCPASTAYVPGLVEWNERYADKGVRFVGVFSHPTDEASDIVAFAKNANISFPVLRDADRSLARKLSVERVPTAILLDAGRTVRYAGRIDNHYAPGIQRDKATTRELRNAIDCVLDEKEVAVKHAPAAGCLLPRDQKTVAEVDGSITYHKQVVRIIQNKCQSCHRPGEIGPFTLMSYKSAKGWSEMIREVVSNGSMPPWHADAPHGHFSNDRRLADNDKQTLLTWIERGCPEGDPKDSPEPIAFVDGWRLERKPDQVIEMNKTIDVPASYLGGLMGMPYQYVPAGKPFEEDKWVTQLEVRPDFRPAIHHIIAFLIPPGTTPQEALAKGSFGRYLLGSYVPGDSPAIFPKGMAKKLPKGSWILFEVHYTPNGVAGKDRSSIGLCYTKEPPPIQAESIDITNQRFTIPAGASNYEVRSQRVFKNPTTIIAYSPHMHVRGKAFRYELVSKDAQGKETRELLLNVPKYDFNWQTAYIPKTPKAIPAGSRIECTAWFDNSAENPFNPDPKRKVFWGNQTWEEMMIGFLEYYETK